MAQSNDGEQWDEDDKYYSSQSDDSPILSNRYDKYRRYDQLDLRPERTRRSTLTVLARFFLFCAAMILFCVLMYIPVYNRANYQIPKGTVAGWSINTNRDTKIYVQPNNVTTILEPKSVCNKTDSHKKNTLFLLIVVCSSTKHFDRRKAIRETWGNHELYKKSYKIFAKVREKYKNYNYTHDLYPKFSDLSIMYGNTSAINVTFANNVSNDNNGINDINEHNDINVNERNGNEHNDVSDKVINNVSRTKRDISSFNRLLPEIAKALKNNLDDEKEKTDDFAEQEKRFDDSEEPIVPEFDMNKEIGEENDQVNGNFDYDYESNIMKIPPKGEEHNRDLSKVIDLLKKNNALDSLKDIDETIDIEAEYKLVFILGLPHENDSETQGRIEEESNKYGDIIQEDFLDSYNNLTLKSIMMLKWITNKCNDSVRYILKTDDDMYINVPNLMLDLKNRSTVFDKQLESKPKDIEYLLIGDLICGAKPVLDSRDKWYSPRYMYGARVYPRYLSGTGYLFSSATAHALYKAALSASLFHLEDVYITGICSVRSIPRQTPRDDPLFSYRGSSGACWGHSHVTSHKHDPALMRSVADKLVDLDAVDRCERMRLTQVRREKMKPKATPKRPKLTKIPIALI